jgi:hypothetical protein
MAGGDKAHESLLLTLGMLDTTLVKNGSLLIRAVRTKMNDDATVSDKATKKALTALIEGIVNEIQ